MAASVVAQRPPSENESGVTLTTPISTGSPVAAGPCQPRLLLISAIASERVAALCI